MAMTLRECQNFFNPEVFREMAQLGTHKANEVKMKMVKSEVQNEVSKFHREFPSIWNILSQGADDGECEKMRIDNFSDCKVTFDGMWLLKLDQEEHMKMTEAVFTKCVDAAKQICPN